MPVNNITIQKDLVILDSVTFAVDFSNAKAISIQKHPNGECFVCGSARAMLTAQQAQELISAGVSDLR